MGDHADSASLLGFDFAEHMHRFVEVSLEVPAHDVQHFDENRIAERVEDLVAFFSIRHQLSAAQNGQMLGEVGLLDRELFLNRARRELPVSQHFDDGDTSGMCQGLEDVSLVRAKRTLHSSIVFEIANIRKYAVAGFKRMCSDSAREIMDLTIGIHDA